jgi:hypothetical protein
MHSYIYTSIERHLPSQVADRPHIQTRYSMIYYLWSSYNVSSTQSAAHSTVASSIDNPKELPSVNCFDCYHDVVRQCDGYPSITKRISHLSSLRINRSTTNLNTQIRMSSWRKWNPPLWRWRVKSNHCRTKTAFLSENHISKNSANKRNSCRAQYDSRKAEFHACDWELWSQIQVILRSHASDTSKRQF